jgi:hypothetical protein
METVSRTDLILDLLEAQPPDGLCDDGISGILDIKPRQAINQICRNLEQEGRLLRHKGECPHCRRSKILNMLTPSRSSGTSQHMVHQRMTKIVDPSMETGIDAKRRHVVRFCREIWKDKKRAEPSPPMGAAALILALRDEKVFPSHQANMMLTICSLRNVHEYQNLKFGPREVQIEQAAWGIIEEWATQFHPELWKKAG